MTTTPMPSFPALLAGLARRRLVPETRDGRLVLVGDMTQVDAVLAVVVRWYAKELRALVAGRASGHVVGVCDTCGQWSFIHRTKTPRCRLAWHCPGRHRSKEDNP
jgi:hypothetical protein